MSDRAEIMKEADGKRARLKANKQKLLEIANVIQLLYGEIGFTVGCRTESMIAVDHIRAIVRDLP